MQIWTSIHRRSTFSKRVPLLRELPACFVIVLVMISHAAIAQTYTVLHTFTGPPDGAGPVAMMLDNAGNFYGATLAGGATKGSKYCSIGGCGTIFKIDASGKETVVYAFAPTNVSTGYRPGGPSLVEDAEGNIYGTAQLGGAFECGLYGLGCGTVFEVTATGQETVLHRFGDAKGNGAGPSGLVRDAAGNLYGATSGGGGYGADGSVFKLDSAGNETVLHTFTGYPKDGALPGGLVLDSEGNLYGLTGAGGVRGAGTIFEISSTGVETILHDFGASGSNGTAVRAPLARDSAGNLYGTTAYGGDANCLEGEGCGVVYKLDPAGHYGVLHSFTGGADGENPGTGVTLDAAGNLYGTTFFGGGKDDCGTVFKLSPSGSLTVLHTFSATECGNNIVDPSSAPIVDGQGNVYGTTYYGGDVNYACIYGCGMVFKITP
jgi:uncharacterized repeat protein (TIGR03803 family)